MSEIMRHVRAAVLEPAPARVSEQTHHCGGELACAARHSDSGDCRRISWSASHPTARIYFIAASVAFTSAGAGWLVNHFLTGWMEVAGMAAVGLFYLSLGLLELGRRPHW